MKDKALLLAFYNLQTFAGLNALVGKAFDNPYKYENQQVAFDDDVEKFNALMRG